jgi:hypothetical protein
MSTEGESMQTEQSIKPNGFESVVNDTYKSNAVESSADYPFDATPLSVEVPHAGNVVLVSYEKPDLDIYLARQKAQGAKTRITGGAIQVAPIEHTADIEFFDQVVLGAKKRKSDSIESIREYDQREARRFPWEFKVKAVKAMTTFKVKVEASGDEMLEPDGDLLVTLSVGQFAIDFTMSPLTGAQRKGYLNANKSESKFKNGDTIIETEPHYIEKAMKLFAGDRDGRNGAFVSLIGGRLESGPYSSERKAEFIAQIDPLMQMSVIEGICDYYSGDQD